MFTTICVECCVPWQWLPRVNWKGKLLFHAIRCGMPISSNTLHTLLELLPKKTRRAGSHNVAYLCCLSNSEQQAPTGTAHWICAVRARVRARFMSNAKDLCSASYNVARRPPFAQKGGLTARTDCCTHKIHVSKTSISSNADLAPGMVLWVSWYVSSPASHASLSRCRHVCLTVASS